jgi:aminoglycoside phosphotransferase (APT) family kinase protein
MLLHDESSSILVQSDLGVLPNLYHILTDTTTSVSLSAEVGHVVGQFLANMHCSTPVKHSDIEDFCNTDAERLMHAIIAQATTFMQDAGVTDFRSLGQLALDHWISRKKTVFAQGDLWFGTLLVDVNPIGGDKPVSVVVGVCDWEFAGPNDPSADLAQLGCYLHLLSSSPLITRQMEEVICTFSENLYETYFASLKTRLDSTFWNSLFIMHGWEMVNAAGWKTRQHMWCACEGHGVRCIHIRRMVQEGAKFLRIALTTAEGKSEGFQHPLGVDGIEWSRYFPLV